jgi:hypothetical protein
LLDVVEVVADTEDVGVPGEKLGMRYVGSVFVIYLADGGGTGLASVDHVQVASRGEAEGGGCCAVCGTAKLTKGTVGHLVFFGELATV